MHNNDDNVYIPRNSRLRDIDPDDNFFNDVYQGLAEREISQYYTVERYNEAFGDTQSYLSCMSFNISSFKKNIDVFTSMIEALSVKQDIIVLTETWSDGDTEELYALEGYNGFHCSRQGRSGGVSVYCADNLVANRLEELSVTNIIIESCAVEILREGDSFFIFAIYKPHSCSVNEFSVELDRMLHSVALRGKAVILLGDLNIDLLKQNSNHTTDFANNMRSLNYFPIITKATRFPVGEAAGSPSLLDHIWFNSIRRFNSGIITFALTDHCPVFVNILTPVNSDEKIKLTFRIHQRPLVEKYRSELLNVINEFVFEGCINIQTSSFIDAINALYVKCFPLK